MTSLRSTLLACACLLILTSCAATYLHDQASAIATAPYPGERVLDKCSPYADALFDALKAANIEAWKVYYMGGVTQDYYLHAIVVYKDAGAYWYVDNMFPFPTKSWGKTPRECAKDRSERDSAYCLVLKVIPSRPDPVTPQPTPPPPEKPPTAPGPS
ncbi:MAG: hypothetical protein WCD79_17495 [Chthoniobacteraceae bacterium]